MSRKPICKAEVIRYRDGAFEASPDWLVREEPLEIRVKGASVAVTMRTPGHDTELACGFLLTEGLLRKRTDLVEAAHCRSEASGAGNILNVFLSPETPVDLDRLARHNFASSSCGLCGKASIESVHQHFPPVECSLPIDPAVLTGLATTVRTHQESFTKTGGLHAAGIFDFSGRLFVCREDVGRHNAVDKVVGWAFLQGRLPLEEHLLFVSGRASFEIMQKALAARIPVVAAVSAPSSLAVEFARESNQTLIGFLRGDSFNIYAGPDRLRPVKTSGRRTKLR